jgi:D-arabinose 1-dehydrogenase-like Zn-dependent alcohol dehydrogenase
MGLAPNGKLLVIGAPTDAIQVPAFALIRQRSSIEGVYSGTAIDSEDTLAFSLLTNVRSMNEVFPFKELPQAYERMLSGAARFRAVLDMSR